MPLLIDAWSLPDPAQDLPADAGGPRVAIFGGGCFWCTEAVYTAVAGVLEVRPGYAGDSSITADYRTVCTGRTNHAEVIEITYDPAQVTYGQLLKLFFGVAHDPTQKDRQGADVGRQYRSVIFYATPDEQAVAQAYMRQLDAAKIYSGPILTTLEPLTAFYVAEPEHHDYAARNPGNPYIAGVSTPKVKKLKQYFPHWLKAER